MALLVPIVQLVQIVLNLYWYVVIAAVIMSWLVTFGVINSHNQIVHMIGSALRQMTEPVFRKIRQYVPIMGGDGPLSDCLAPRSLGSPRPISACWPDGC